MRSIEYRDRWKSYGVERAVEVDWFEGDSKLYLEVRNGNGHQRAVTSIPPKRARRLGMKLIAAADAASAAKAAKE